jgi:prolyl-tRNA synthetase
VVTFIRRDKLRSGDKIPSIGTHYQDFVERATDILTCIQATLFAEAKARHVVNIKTDVDTVDQLEAYFGPGEDDEDKAVEVRGWVRCAWSEPTGSTLEIIATRLKALKLTIRNAPLVQPVKMRACIFTGAPGVEEILVSRAY